MNHTDQQLWETILWAGNDDNNEPLDLNYGFDDIDPDDAAVLDAAYWQWRDSVDAVLIRHGLGELSIEDLARAGRVAHYYVLVRDRHGVSFTDQWLPGPEHACCSELDQLAMQQGPIGAYVGDDGRIYCSWCE